MAIPKGRYQYVKDEAAMSASQDKKRRQSERAEGVDKRSLAEREAAQKAKKERRTWTIIGIVIAVLAVIIILLNTNLLYTGTTAVTIGDDEYTNAEFQYYYYSALSNFEYNYGSYLSFFFDTSVPLDDQEFDESMASSFGLSIPESISGAEGLTWQDYFSALALDNMQEVTALYNAAVAEGYTLSEEDAATIDETIASFETTASTNGWRDGDAYASVVYGKGVDLDTVREQMERATIAGNYSQDVFDSFEYTPEELSEYYAEYRDVFDTFDFAYYLVSADTVETTETVVDEETGEETEETTEAVTDETMAEAMQTAEDILTAYESGTEAAALSFAEAITEVLGDEAGEPSEYPLAQGYYVSMYMNDNIADWVLDSARESGDTTVIENEGTGYYVVVFNGRSDNNVETVSFRHILIEAVDEDEDGEYSEEELSAALDELEGIYEEWQNGEATEESFYELQQEYSDDVNSSTGQLYGDENGVYTHILEGSMVEELDEFIFDPAREYGDTAIVHGESSSYNGYHLVYFVCVDDEPYCDYLADVGVSGTEAEGLRNIDYSAWHDELLSGYTVSVNSFINWFAKL